MRRIAYVRVIKALSEKIMQLDKKRTQTSSATLSTVWFGHLKFAVIIMTTQYTGITCIESYVEIG